MPPVLRSNRRRRAQQLAAATVGLPSTSTNNNINNNNNNNASTSSSNVPANVELNAIATSSTSGATKHEILIRRMWGEVTKNLCDESNYYVQPKWLVELPEEDQKVVVSATLSKLKSDLRYKNMMCAFIGFYWPAKLKLPIEPEAINGVDHFILLQTFPNTTEQELPVSGLRVGKSLFLEDLVSQSNRTFMRSQPLAEGVQATYAPKRVPFEALPPKEKQRATSVLGRYLCPRKATCSRALHQCLFEHNAWSGAPELPNYVCFNYLLYTCNEELRDWRAAEPSSQNATTCANDECCLGLHVSAKELAEGFDTNPANQKRIESYRKQFPHEIYECCICMDNIRLDRRVPEQMEFCIFETCSHVHCARCVIEFSRGDDHFLNQKQYKCSCLCPNEKVLFQHFYPTIESPKEKQDVFDTLPSALVHTLRGFANFYRYSLGTYLSTVLLNHCDVPLPSRIVDIMARVKVDFAGTACTMAFMPPMLWNHFGLCRDFVLKNLPMLTGNGQKLYEFDTTTGTFVPFKA